MRIDDFIKHVSSQQILTAEEVQDITLYMHGSVPRKDLQYSTKTRDPT